MKSNGFFLTRDFDIDINEDIDFYDLEENGEIIANLMVWGYNKLINDLKILPKKIGEDEEDNLIYNCYVEFTETNKFWFTISFYDFDEEYLDKDIVKKIKEINQEIRIEINTKEEIEMFKNKVNNALVDLGYKNIGMAFKLEKDMRK